MDAHTSHVYVVIVWCAFVAVSGFAPQRAIVQGQEV